ncbi:hypothetical protein PM082_023178 [Marasmius tenuissimus]|nr:hypothetical protein PM082_023178 [Marasmius tenuissimus]
MKGRELGEGNFRIQTSVLIIICGKIGFCILEARPSASSASDFRSRSEAFLKSSRSVATHRLLNLGTRTELECFISPANKLNSPRCLPRPPRRPQATPVLYEDIHTSSSTCSCSHTLV